MIKCPKCSFEQPEDIYCAQCGVNMKNFVVKKPNIIVAFLKNQPLQLAILCIAIISFVIYDQSKSSGKRFSKIESAANGRFFQQQHHSDDDTNSSEPQKNSAPTTSIQPAQETSSEAPSSSSRRPSPAAKKIEGAPKTSVQLSFYQASKNALSELQKESQGNLSVDAIGGLIWKKKLNQLKTSGELKNISTTRYKLDNHPINVFKGQRSTESGKNIGMYFQINTLRNDASATQFEVKSWGTLKAQDSDESFFTSEMTLSDQFSGFIYGFLPKDKAFSDEEKAVFESDKALKIYNQEDFWDGNTDLMILIEFPESP